MERVVLGEGIDFSRIVYGMWRIKDDCPSSYKMGHQSGLSIGGSGSFV
jgi:predicted oxidoreductase